MPGSPQKKRTKRKAMDSDLKVPEGQEGLVKKPRAHAELPSTTNQADESQNPRRSGCSGAGQGGRGTQLEKIGAILHAPARTNKVKGATSLNLNAPANPLAPEPPRKGQGSCPKKKQLPPPYSPLETLNVMTSTSHSKKRKTPVTPTPSFELNDHPTFSQCEAEPDLQALNNPFVAAARKLHALTTSDASQSEINIGTSHSSQSQAPASKAHHMITTPRVNDPAPSRMTSTITARSDTNYPHNLDPVLRLSTPLNTDFEESDTSSDEGSSSLDEGGGDEIGWGEVGRRHDTRPGFSREELPSQPQVATVLPTDFHFQHSRDEDDQVAERTLVVGGDSSKGSVTTDQESAPQPDDVLKVHHKRNGHPHLPDPALLELLRTAEVDAPNSKAKPKAKRNQKSKNFLEDVKGECHTQQALEKPFPSLVVDLPISITESLSALLVQWLKTGHEVDAGVWPMHKPDMLYDDLATWRSDLKKIVVAITPSTYGLVPPADTAIQERAAWVEAAATELLDDGKFLHFGLDNLGKTRNFTHPALLEATVEKKSFCIRTD
ncbi:hypothetical protein DEU56DRAFT_914583 [Suillus clintonianus]|uniref:uncharacterized protein n=1 Tax=Suillus clintonianus TaxID=1904413 RepID=UPI001B85D226|nr:uncharacterized protein DEU56DRAFT_914583 [Suillus clintonianus]KAG2131049.1 hypothetical protein DEU56DRAFT_914583 [Suillus clintonianus]